MAKIVTLGELMLRLSTDNNERFVQANHFSACYGGGEANVAVSLANYKHDAYFVSKFPKNEIGDAAEQSLNRHNVHTDYVLRGGERLGIYYLETGSSLRPSKVIYDRAHSAISEALPDEFNFDEIFKDADWFHFSGITPALSDSAAKVLEKALVCAKKYNVTVSCDLNYRKKLWSSEKAISVMRPLMKYVDVCIGNEEDAKFCLGFTPNSDVEKGQTDAKGYYSIFEKMQKEFSFKYIASTLRESYSASHNGWKALIYNGKDFYESKHYDIFPIVDRVGAGDSFSGGLIHGLIKYEGDQEKALEFAVAASALKHTIPGDYNHVDEKEVEALMLGDGSGRVQR